MPVIFFHAGYAGFSGGFIGVDIFFVISGFLITTIIVSQAEENRFTFKEFYFRRAKRLLPTLFVVMLASIVCGYFLLLPGTYRELFESTVWTSFFASNLFFHENVNYFSQASEFMPLLHTWSLAVEEQFYLIWPPVLLVFVWLLKNGRAWFAHTLLVTIIFSSYLASQFYMHTNPSMVFYMTPLRLWELGIGALAAIYFRYFQRTTNSAIINSAYCFGLFLVIASIIHLNKEVAFPGFNALPVVFGTALMLLYGHRKSNFVAQLFASPVLVYIGKISYTLYLWHWVVFAYIRIYQNDIHLSLVTSIFGIGLTFLLSITTYIFVESPFRFNTDRAKIWVTAGLGIALFSFVGWAGVAQKGYPNRIEPSVNYAESQDVMREWPCDKQKFEGLEGATDTLCVFGSPWNKADYRLVLWGDSHADQMAPVIEEALKNDDVSVLLWNGCPPFIDNIKVKRWHDRSSQFSDRCGRLFSSMNDWLKTSFYPPNGIVVSSSFEQYPESLYSDSLENLSREHGVGLTGAGLNEFVRGLPEYLPVIILTDFPSPGGNPSDCAVQRANGIFRKRIIGSCDDLNIEMIKEKYASTNHVLFNVADKFSNITIIDSLISWCGDNDCPMFIGDRVLYRDGSHIRENLSQLEKAKISDALNLREVLIDALNNSTRPTNESPFTPNHIGFNPLNISSWQNPVEGANERVPATSAPSIIFGDRSLKSFKDFTSENFTLPGNLPLTLKISYRYRKTAENIAILKLSNDQTDFNVFIGRNKVAFTNSEGDLVYVDNTVKGDVATAVIPLPAFENPDEYWLKLYPAGANSFGVPDRASSGYFELMALSIF